MRKTLQLLMALFAISFASAQTVGDVFTVNNIQYEATSLNPNQAKVLGFDDLDTAVAVVDIPTTTTDASNNTVYDVKTIGIGAFSTNSAANKGAGDARNNIITEVILPVSVVTIEAHAFRELKNLTAINLENIVSTGSNSLNGCTKLTEVDLSSLVDFGQYTFVGNDLIKNIDLPSTLTTFGIGAIFDLDGLGSINIPSSITNIGKNFLRRCDNLSSIQLNWTDLSVLTFDEESFLGDLTASNITLYVPVSDLSDYQSSAFNITGVNIIGGTLPTTFVGQLFTDNGVNYDVTSLSPNEAAVSGGGVGATLTIGETATNGSDVFAVTAIGASAFQGNEVITDVVLPNTVKTINANAFRLCSSLVNINTENVTTIGGNILREAPNVTTLDLSSVEVMENNALGRAYGLTGALDLPNIQTMGKWCFVYVQGVTEVNIGSSLSSITTDTFLGMPSLAKVKVDVETPVVLDGPFNAGASNDETPSAMLFPALPIPDFANVTLQVPTAAAVTAYETATGWSVFGLTNTDGSLSVEDILSGNLGIDISSDVVTVNSSSTFTNGNLSIYDITGRLLVSKALNGASYPVNISSLASGVYILKVSEDGAKLVKRFVKQ